VKTIYKQRNDCKGDTLTRSDVSAVVNACFNESYTALPPTIPYFDDDKMSESKAIGRTDIRTGAVSRGRASNR
jgi:hypothetical protein